VPSALLLTIENGSSSFEDHFPAFVSILSTDLATFSYTKLGDLPGRHSSWFRPFFSSFETIDRLETWFDYLRKPGWRSKPSQLKLYFFKRRLFFLGRRFPAILFFEADLKTKHSFRDVRLQLQTLKLYKIILGNWSMEEKSLKGRNLSFQKKATRQKTLQ